METHHIRFVRAVADHQNISAAARDLGLTQPALTKIVSRVEDSVGAKLFDRGPRGVTLTPFGELFLHRMARVEQDVLMLSDEVRARKSGLSGTVSLGVGQFWLGRILPVVIAEMAQRTPGVQVKIHTGAREELFHRLRQGEVDLVLARITDDLPEEMVGEALGEVRMFLLARKGHPLEQEQRVTLDAIAPHGWILPPRNDPSIRYGFTDVGVEPPVARVEAVSHKLVYSLLEASDMVTLVPDMTHSEVPPGLCRLQADWLNWSCSVGAIRIVDRSILPCCEMFLQRLREATGELSPPAPRRRARNAG